MTNLVKTFKSGLSQQKISSYFKGQLSDIDLASGLEHNKMKIILNNMERGMFTIIAEKMFD